MWFRRLLAALGIAYEVLRCVACGVEVLIRKGAIAPPGWFRRAIGWLCPRCDG